MSPCYMFSRCRSGVPPLDGYRWVSELFFRVQTVGRVSFHGAERDVVGLVDHHPAAIARHVCPCGVRRVLRGHRVAGYQVRTQGAALHGRGQRAPDVRVNL